MAFYFLLWVGEYIQPQASQSTQTRQFCLQDVLFFVQQHPIAFQQLQHNPGLPDMVHLHIDN